MAEVFGLELQDGLSEDEVPVDAIVIIKYLNPHNENYSFLVTSTPTLSGMEALGLLRAAMKNQEREILDQWGNADEDD